MRWSLAVGTQLTDRKTFFFYCIWQPLSFRDTIQLINIFWGVFLRLGSGGPLLRRKHFK